MGRTNEHYDKKIISESANQLRKTKRVYCFSFTQAIEIEKRSKLLCSIKKVEDGLFEVTRIEMCRKGEHKKRVLRRNNQGNVGQ